MEQGLQWCYTTNRNGGKTMVSEEKKRVFVSLKLDTIKNLETIANKLGLTKSNMIELAVQEYLRKGHEL